MPRCEAGQPVPLVRISGLPDSVADVWSLWAISLAAEGFSRRRFLPVFVTADGRAVMPTARRIWDLRLSEQIEVLQTQASWGTCERVDKGRRVIRNPPTAITDEALIGWLIEAAIRNTGRAIGVSGRPSAAVLYPFRLDHSPTLGVPPAQPAQRGRHGGHHDGARRIASSLIAGRIQASTSAAVRQIDQGDPAHDEPGAEERQGVELDLPKEEPGEGRHEQRIGDLDQ